jgi:hypothetical protein
VCTLVRAKQPFYALLGNGLRIQTPSATTLGAAVAPSLQQGKAKGGSDDTQIQDRGSRFNAGKNPFYDGK